MSEDKQKKLREILKMKPSEAVYEAQIYMMYPQSDQKLENGRYPYQQIVASKIDEMQASPCNLLIASPTGSGKTFAIEYAALWAAQSNSTLCIAEPLIALAKQIYTVLSGRVDKALLSLKTGPISKGELDEAKILICTFEVLARLTSDFSPFFTSCKTVVIDEIHCIESDRGPVLLEILTGCQNKNIIALSGTLPNKKEFAKFLGSMNDNPTYVTGARTRPVPLQFYHYNTSRQICSPLVESDRIPELNPDLIGGLVGKQDMLSCIRCLQRHDSEPILFVLFSIRKLDQMADWTSCLDLVNGSQKSQITVIFNSMLRTIPEEDRCLFDSLKMLALKGIGKHHSHLPVPYLEVVCSLAEKRLIKIVFSSSTLSAGINLPVRTVVHCGAYIPQKKSDGSMSHEIVSPLLFHQLSGRAGRPQFERNGYVVIVGKNDISYSSAQALMQRSLTSIIPYTELNIGDVMRGMRQCRNLSFEQARFQDPSLKYKIDFANCVHDRIHKLCNEISEINVLKHATEICQATNTIVNNNSCMRWAKIQDSHKKVLVISPLGEISIETNVETIQNDSWWVELTTDKPIPKKYPVQHVNEILETQKAVEILVRTDVDSTVMLLASVLRYKKYWENFNNLNSTAIEIEKICDQIPSIFKGSSCILNPLGVAACDIRAVKNPCVVIEALLSYGPLSSTDLLEFCSAVLQDGKPDPEARVYINTLAKFSALRKLENLTESRLIKAVIEWGSMETLFTITNKENACSVGVLCRHLLRVSEVLQEFREFFSQMHIEGLSMQLEEAFSNINRGLPFMRREVEEV